MSVQENETVEPEVTATSEVQETTEDKISSMIDSMMNPAEADADEPEVEEVPEEEPQPQPVEGPSIAMKMLAGQSGVPEKLLALAKSDDDVKLLIDQFRPASQEEKQPEEDKEPLLPLLDLELSEDDFPEGDPVRKVLERIQDHTAKRDTKILELLNGLAGYLSETRGMVDQTTNQNLAALVGRFDAFVDGLGIDVLGNRSQQELNPAAQHLRQLVWDRYWELAGDKPPANPEALYRQAVEQIGFTTKETTRQQALEQSSKQRLGGGPARAIPDKGQTAEAKFDSLLSSLGVKQ